MPISISHVRHSRPYVTAKVGVPCKDAVRVIGVIGTRANGDRGIVSKEEGLRPRVLANAEGNSGGGE